MAYGHGKRSLCILLAACALQALTSAAAAQQRSPTEPAQADEASAEDGSGAPRGEGRLSAPSPNDAGRLQQPLDSTLLRDSGEIDQNVLIEPNVEAPSGPSLVFPDENLEGGPAISQRENLPDSPRAGTLSAPAGPIDAGQPPRPPVGPSPADTPDLFRAIGPVRSPTLNDVAGRRLTDGLEGLRRTVPLGTDDPFAPVGKRIGSFVGTASLDQSVGASDNLTLSRDGVSGAFSQTTASGRLVSDWSRHEAEINAAATYRRNFSGPVEEEPQIEADARLRLDLTRNMTGTLRGAVSFRREDDLTSGVALDAASRADVLRYSIGGDLEARFGRLDTTTSLQAVRDDLSDRARLGTVALTDDSFTTYTAGLRAALGERSALHPFVGASLGRRVFDQERVGSISRDSVIPALRGGVGFNRGEKLSGEIALGYAWNLPDDDTLDTVASPTIDAILNWSPRRGTEVTLRGVTTFDPETTGIDTATLYEASLAIRHRATARLQLDAALTAGLRERERLDTEYLLGGEAGFTYWMNRRLALTGVYRYDRFDGALPGSDYDANTVRLGVKLQN